MKGLWKLTVPSSDSPDWIIIEQRDLQLMSKLKQPLPPRGSAGPAGSKHEPLQMAPAAACGGSYKVTHTKAMEKQALWSTKKVDKAAQLLPSRLKIVTCPVYF